MLVLRPARHLGAVGRFFAWIGCGAAGPIGLQPGDGGFSEGSGAARERRLDGRAFSRH